jgi:hypothetical protein
VFGFRHHERQPAVFVFEQKLAAFQAVWLAHSNEESFRRAIIPKLRSMGYLNVNVARHLCRVARRECSGGLAVRSWQAFARWASSPGCAQAWFPTASSASEILCPESQPREPSLSKAVKHHWYGDTSPWTEQRLEDHAALDGRHTLPPKRVGWKVVILDRTAAAAARRGQLRPLGSDR